MEKTSGSAHEKDSALSAPLTVTVLLVVIGAGSVAIILLALYL
jgi:hypothetical protein